MIKIRHKGSYKKTENFLKKIEKVDIFTLLHKYGEMGVKLLSGATPKDTGATANSWSYKIERKETNTTLVFLNTNVQNGMNIAILLQYGHGTGTGGYVRGRDYINPALRPLFDSIVDDLGKEVAKL